MWAERCASQDVKRLPIRSKLASLPVLFTSGKVHDAAFAIRIVLCEHRGCCVMQTGAGVMQQIAAAMHGCTIDRHNTTGNQKMANLRIEAPLVDGSLMPYIGEGASCKDAVTYMCGDDLRPPAQCVKITVVTQAGKVLLLTIPNDSNSSVRVTLDGAVI